MGAFPLAVRAGAAAATLFFLSLANAATPQAPSGNATPQQLVDAALRTELAGPSAKRDELLRQALALDENFAPARWQLGFVRWDDEWLALDEVARRVAGDPILTEYRKRRDAMVDMADSHRELARWCRKNRLNDEERIHWAKVLEFDSQDAEALTALGLQLYEGRLLNKQQIAAAKQQAGERLKALKHWQPKLAKWRTAIQSGSNKERREALAGLEELSDPAAIPALEATFLTNGRGDTARQLEGLLIQTVGRMPVPEATQVLLRRALDPNSQCVGAAADELSRRPKFAYVPQLLAALPGKLSTRFRVYVSPNGTVVHEHEFLLNDRDTEFAFRYDSTVHLTDPALASVVTPRSVNRELAAAAQLEQGAQQVEQQNSLWRQRIEMILERAAGFSRAEDATGWAEQYRKYLESYESNWLPSRRYLAASASNYEAYFPIPRERPEEQNRSAVDQAGEPSAAPQTATAVSRRPPGRFGPESGGLIIMGIECFAAGTPVLTIEGPRPIESLKAGDRIVAQQAMTGEIRYKSVQTVTIRPAAALIKITTGSQTITATRGHSLWVDGAGWTMAKDLKVGQYLHGLDGATHIDALEETPAREAYNLVVSDYGTYFVGERPVLVHDNSPLAETIALVPGLTAPQADSTTGLSAADEP
ncbi:MAG: polymorphic toxin-type HINT domain-containing protein [Pirellulales bacterium]